ncbi:MAG: DUF3817 domain-containing protein [Acidimicrobiales bacterium]
MAYVVGVGLILVCAGIPPQLLGYPEFENVIGVVHGIFYIIYLLASFALYRKAHFTKLQLVGLVSAGFVPLLAFYVERRTTKRISRDLVALDLAAGPSTPGPSTPGPSTSGPSTSGPSTVTPES